MSDCLIVGGGVIGMMSARYLADAGAQVTIIDKQSCGMESSWAGGGIISPLYPWHYDDLTNELSQASQLVYENLCAEMQSNTGIDPQYVRSGLLMLDEYDSDSAIKCMKKFNINYTPVAQGALFSNIAQVRNPRLVQALKADVVSKGVNIVEGTQAQSLITSGSRVDGVDTNHGQIFADNVVVCSGAWSSQWLGLTDEIFPMKGQMIVIDAVENLEHIILDQGRYIIPRKDGKTLVGSTMEDIGFDKSTDRKVAGSLFEFAQTRVEGIKGKKIIHHWSGFRPASRSGKVILGRDDKYNNLYINTGHFRNGLNMAPESAYRIKQLITNE